MLLTFFLGDRWFTVGYNPAHQMHHSWDSSSEVVVEFVPAVESDPGPEVEAGVDALMSVCHGGVILSVVSAFFTILFEVSFVALGCAVTLLQKGSKRRLLAGVTADEAGVLSRTRCRGRPRGWRWFR